MPVKRKKKQPKRPKVNPRHHEGHLPPPGKIHGGKGDGKGKIIREMYPDPLDYVMNVEAFGGLASVMLNLPTIGTILTDGSSLARVDIYVDANPRLVQMFTTLGDIKLHAAIIHKMANTPYSDELHKMSIDTAAWQKLRDPVEKMWWTFIMYAMSYSGRTESDPKPGEESYRAACMSHAGKRPRRGIAETVSAFREKCDIHAPDWMEIIKQWECISQMSGLAAIRKYNKKRGDLVMYYLDPPYLPSTRQEGSRELYHGYEMTDTDHEELLQLINTVDGKVLLSGYPSDMYDDYLKRSNGWHRFQWEAPRQGSAAGAKKSWAKETLWFNYPPPKQLPNATKGVLLF